MSSQPDYVLDQAKAYQEINRRAEDAHAYAHQYLMPGAWGKNIWHAILDDAIRIRKLVDQINGNP